jgi:putative oxidoreductase
VIGRILTGRGLNVALRFVIGGVLLYAAVHKVLHPTAFAMSVRGYKIIPFALSNLFALTVSWGELFAGLMLIFGILPRKAAGAAVILLVMFVIAIATVLVRGMVVDCGCFASEGGARTSWLLIARNLALVAGAVIVVCYNDGFASLWPDVRNRGSRADSLTS